MTERRQVEELVRRLHAARLDGSLESLCALFGPEARMRIQGTSDGKPIAVGASGGQIRAWLSILVKTFRLGGYRFATHRRGLESPGPHCGKANRIELVAHPLYQGRAHHRSVHVQLYIHHDLLLGPWQKRSIDDGRVWREDRKRRTNILIVTSISCKGPAGTIACMRLRRSAAAGCL